MNQPPGGFPPGPPPGYPPPGYGYAPPGYAPQQQPQQQQPQQGYPQQGYPQQGYPQAYPPPGYGAPPIYVNAQPPPGYGPAGFAQPAQLRVMHPKANTALILGALSWVLGLWLVCSIPAWVIGAGALRDIRANPQTYTGETEAKIGMWMGIVHTLLPIVIGIPIILLVALSVSSR